MLCRCISQNRTSYSKLLWQAHRTFLSNSIITTATAASVNSLYPWTILRSMSSSTERPRRRRHGGSSLSDQKVTGITANSSFLDFILRAKEYLDLMEKALRPMKDHNAIFELERSDTELKLKLADGEYTLTIHEGTEQMILYSPISGQYFYSFNPQDERWHSQNDDHILEGMLVRDLIKHCNGVPKL
jgi:frataxin-like iron-binding protein CyaY